MAQPEDQELQAAMEVALKVPVVPVKAAEAEILEFIQAAYEPGGPMSRLVGDLEAEELDVESEETAEIGHLRDMAREAPIIQLVNLLVLRAIQMGASDIHLEPFEDAFRVRYRKDGILYETESPPKGLQAAVLSRLKIMARLDINYRDSGKGNYLGGFIRGFDCKFAHNHCRHCKT
jgi:general secretion pathway protein E